MTYHAAGLILFSIVAISALAGSAAPAQDTTAKLVNPGFENGLSGWQASGAASVESADPLSGTESLRLGPGKAAVRQRYAIGGLRIAGFSAILRADPPNTAASVRFQCYDSRNHILLDISKYLDPTKSSPKGSETGVYLKTQAHTAYVVVSIVKDTDGPGYVYADDAELDDYDAGRTVHAPTCKLGQYLLPIWQAGTVYNETVLLESVHGKPASGNLLFKPDRIISVQDYALTTSYTQGKDYTIEGKSITRAPDSTIPHVNDTDFPAGDFPWYTIDGKQIVVTYTHSDSWIGPSPAYAGAELPNTIGILRHRRPLTIVADGDSITLGLDVSSYLGIPPYMPTWADLFADKLRHVYGDSKITLFNTALGGMTSQWGLDNAKSTVADLNPDLVLIAFGMNDFWWMPPAEFKHNIEGIMDQVRERRPRAEFILISSIPFDPAYTADPTYTQNMAGYAAALRSLTRTGVQLLDMNSIGAALYAQKKPKDLLGNPMHPNDFLARWYAQGLAAMLTAPDR